jgi:hypothetical protein
LILQNNKNNNFKGPTTLKESLRRARYHSLRSLTGYILKFKMETGKTETIRISERLLSSKISIICLMSSITIMQRKCQSFRFYKPKNNNI